jgi:hypothetical protein
MCLLFSIKQLNSTRAIIVKIENGIIHAYSTTYLSGVREKLLTYVFGGMESPTLF